MSDMIPSRRQFLGTTSALAAAAALSSRTYAADSNTIRIGLVGCGGRGSGAIGNALDADPHLQVVAVGDVFEHKVAAAADRFTKMDPKRVDLPLDKRFVGLDAYKNVIDNVDVVLLATPPGFRPLHIEYAVKQGKHVFAEKPVATDPVGVRRVLAACKEAEKKNLTVVSGLCYRYDAGKQDTIKRLHDGAIGDIRVVSSKYWSGTPWFRDAQPGWSGMQKQLNNWYFYVWLCGDQIAEQAVHSIDKCAWLMKDESPERVVASGGRAVRTDEKFAQIWDNMSVTYEYADGRLVHLGCRQWDGNGIYHTVEDRVIGAKGWANAQSHDIYPDGAEKWSWRRDKDDPRARNMYVEEHVQMYKAIRSNTTINNGSYMCNSTLMGIAGRMSAYAGKALKWEDVVNSKHDLTPADMSIDGPGSTMGVPVPGKYDIG
ncbi:MAG: twin-arginine translocation signal domain-containing protein [Phycisphaera sp.]|nr:twin-arginine translocation signal domain-containing protein [Phycisphaera sp.]